jgi:RNA polymerase sigma-70 factor (ECF subfamily)
VDEDEQIVRAAVAGDRLALAAFVRDTQDHVWRYCAYLGRGDEVADLVQETYVRALRALPRFEGRTSGRVWLLSIARRVCADAVRTAQRRRALEARWRRERRPAPASETVTIELLVESLAPERREAFVLTQVVGLPYAAAAQVCRVPVGTIRSRVARAREELQASIRREDTGT